MRGLPALIRASHYPAIDVQAFPKAVLATGKFEAIKNPARWPGFELFTCQVDRAKAFHSSIASSDAALCLLIASSCSSTKSVMHDLYSAVSEMN